MKNQQILRNALCIIFSLFAFTPALEFSKSSITAYDRYYELHGSSGGDTITIHNNSSVKAIVDSLSFEFDSPLYTQFTIGWMGLQNGSTTIRTFESDNFEFGDECAKVSTSLKTGMTLNEYKHANSSEKILFTPNEKIKIFSPYFSFCRIDLGINFYCPSGCFPDLNVDQISHFNGRIIFFTGINRDTLNLLCERTTYTHITGVKKTVTTNRRSTSTNNHYAVNVMGRKLSTISKLNAYHSIKLQREHSIVLH